jgi:hypothetical protein
MQRPCTWLPKCVYTHWDNINRANIEKSIPTTLAADVPGFSALWQSAAYLGLIGRFNIGALIAGTAGGLLHLSGTSQLLADEATRYGCCLPFHTGPTNTPKP